VVLVLGYGKKRGVAPTVGPETAHSAMNARGKKVVPPGGKGEEEKLRDGARYKTRRKRERRIPPEMPRGKKREGR